MEEENERLRGDSTCTDVSLACTWSSDEAEDDELSAASETKNVSENVRPPPPMPPPPDGGWGWMVVAGCVVSGALVPGLFMCFGVFMNAFLVVFPDSSKSAASWIPSILNSLMNLMGPVTSLLVNAYSCRSVTLAGGVILSSGLVLSFFTSSIEALYFTYGFLGGVGSGMALAPGLYLISQYFQKRRGLATGVCMAASSGGQIAFPYLLQYMLDEYSYRGCILILGGITMNICVSAALYRPLQNNPRPKPNKKINLNIKSTKRKRSSSQCSRISSQSFVAEANGFADLSTTVLQPKTANIQIVKTENKKKSKKSKKSKKNNKTQNSSTGKRLSNNKKLQSESLKSFDRNNLNGLQPALVVDLSNCPRNRTRTLSIESNWILPGIPEEEHEGDEEVNDEHKTEESQMVPFENEEVNQNNNMTPDAEEKLACTRPLLPQDVTVVVTVVGEDEISSKYDSLSPSRQNSCNENSQVISCMHHPFGSVASIVTFEQNSGSKKPPVMQRLFTSLGFYYFRTGVFYILSVSFTCLVVILGSYTMYMPTYGFSIGLTKEESAGLVSVISMASMCGRLIIPSVPDYVKVKRKHIYSGSMMVLAGAIILTAFAYNYTLLVTSLIFFGFTSGGGIAISLNVFLEYIPLKDFAAFFGLVQLVVGIVVLFSSPLFGLLLDTSGDYTSAYFIMAFLAVISSAVIFLDRFAAKIIEDAVVTK